MRENAKMPRCNLAVFIALIGVTLFPPAALAHHEIGRPSYSLSGDSNTPPSIQAELLIGDYMVTYMVYPAFPQPLSQGLINLYTVHYKSGIPFDGRVRFSVRSNEWYSRLGFGSSVERIGTQSPDGAVFRQNYKFHEAGKYMITAEFEAGGEPYIIDFPLRVGPPSPVGPIGAAVAVLAIVLGAVSLTQRRRAMTGKIRAAQRRPGAAKSDKKADL